MQFLEKLISFFVLLLSIPLMGPLLVIIGLQTKKFPIIKQKRRMTLAQKDIIIYKIRTIKEDEKFKNFILSADSIFDKSILADNVPTLCRWLRKSGFDELPQLYNVIKGELALIGPRPLLIEDLKIFKKTDLLNYKRRENIKSKPGITGYWQIFGEREKGFKHLVTLDLFYESNKSFSLDLIIMLKTIVLLLSADHNDSIIKDKLMLKELNKYLS